MTENNQKARVCPLFAIVNRVEPACTCKEEECAWWVQEYEGCCAVSDIADSLTAMFRLEK